MITEWDLYWLTRMDAIKAAVSQLMYCAWGFGIFALGVLAIASFIRTIAHEEIKEKGYDPLVRRWIIATGISTALFIGIAFSALVGTTFIPTTREYAAIRVIPAIANNEELRGLGEEVVTLAKEWIEELRPKEKEASK